MQITINQSSTAHNQPQSVNCVTMNERRGGRRIASQALHTLMSHSSLAKWARPCTAAELLLSVRK